MDNNEAPADEIKMAATHQPDYPPETHSTTHHPHRFHPIAYTEGGGGDSSGGSSAMNALAAAAEARSSPSSSTLAAVAPTTHRTGSTTTSVATGAGVAPTMSTPQQPPQLTTPPPLSATMQYIPPGGRVVESGQEQTGRWTREEHEAFLTGLQLYGKEWKKVAAGVKTRTVVQTRTHAQKYFQKLTKGLDGASESEIQAAMEMLGEAGSTPNPMKVANFAAAAMDLGIGGALPSTSTASKKKRSASKVPYAAVHPPKTPNPISHPISRTDSAATAATLLNMSNDRRVSATSIGPSSATSATTTAGGAYPSQHGFTMNANDANILGDVSSTSASSYVFGSMVGGGISIAPPPTHEELLQAGKYPEPSPAACGKRKLAEIAAAQMLAGVVGATKRRLMMNEPASATKMTATESEEVLGKDRSATPPPPPPPEQGTYMNTPGGTFDAASINAVSNKVQYGSLIGHGGALQILNPDTFGDQSNALNRIRSMSGSASPHTPWDGQIAALVSQVKGHEIPALPLPPAQDPNTTYSAPNQAAMFNKADVASEATLLPLPLRSPRSVLHVAICNSSVTEVSQLCSTLAGSNSPVINERDDAGFHPLHSAVALALLDQAGSNCREALEICQLLINNGADVMCCDKEGNTPLHWAARAGHADVLGLLLQKNCPLDAQNDAGETALHWAMRAGNRGAGAVKALVENGARVNVFNRNFRRPLDVAANGFESKREGEGDDITENDALASTVNLRERRSARWNLMRLSPQCRTLVLHHHECMEHLAKADHDWEVPDRISNIMSTLTNRTTESCVPEDEECFRPCEITVSNEFERATLELLSRIHSAEYLSFVNDLSKELERKRKQQLIEDSQSNSLGEDTDKKREVVPFTPMIQRKIFKGTPTKEDGHSDTAFSAGSLKAARRAAGAVQHAVDCVLVGRNRNAFCIVRPPGHHAGINGLLSDAESCGFCLFNNVAAGAMHALSDEQHRPKCERCAIVDIDAHHGNGTEEIVRKCHDSGRLLFFSVHLYDYDRPVKGKFQYKFYPGTGAEDEVAHNIINVPIAPLWREKDVVKSISLASNGGASMPTELRQTRQRSKEDAARRVPSVPDLSALNTEEAILVASLKPINGNTSVETASVTSDSSQSSKPRQPLPSASPHYPPHYLMGVGRLAYRRAIQHRLLPALRAFNPDLIILSTGFDAARGDVGNARHYINGTEAMGFDLEPDDYAWTARKVCEIADICCDGRVVSVLEGGYGRTPPSVPAPPVFGDEPASEPVKQRLDKSFFSECAIQHLKGLVDPYYTDEQDQRDASNRKRL